jgi:hypothetical protein
MAITHTGVWRKVSFVVIVVSNTGVRIGVIELVFVPGRESSFWTQVPRLWTITIPTTPTVVVVFNLSPRHGEIHGLNSVRCTEFFHE